ncbi:MAG: deoxyguanosinetriphosphate triphosphohydrolase [Pseudomonadota bacterium]
MLAPFACDPANSRGRLIEEDGSAHRSPYQRDRDRIIHATAFRRLKHKTQVFVEHEGDHFRTRLTHSIEVAQLSRTIAKALNVQEELTEAVALAHDLGHTPFGHVGEDVLDECLKDVGGYDHNAQAIKIVTYLERKYARFYGLNLTWETLEGIAKHNGPVIGDLPPELAAYNKTHDLELNTYASVEAQIAALSDDIAYNVHDTDDGIRAGFFTLEDLMPFDIIGPLIRDVDRLYPGLDRRRRKSEILRRMYGILVDDLLLTSKARLDDAAPASEQDVRQQDRPVVAFSFDMHSNLQALRQFLYQNMYRHPEVTEMRVFASECVRDLFEYYASHRDLLPEGWLDEAGSEIAKLRAIGDYIAGMTDRFAIKTYEVTHGKRPPEFGR